MVMVVPHPHSYKRFVSFDAMHRDYIFGKSQTLGDYQMCLEVLMSGYYRFINELKTCCTVIQSVAKLWISRAHKDRLIIQVTWHTFDLFVMARRMKVDTNLTSVVCR